MDTGERVKARVGIEEYQAKNLAFREIHLGTDREYANNNESPKALQTDLAGFLVDRRSGSLGQNRTNERKNGALGYNITQAGEDEGSNPVGKSLVEIQPTY